jgi:hypothetical protein
MAAKLAGFVPFRAPFRGMRASAGQHSASKRRVDLEEVALAASVSAAPRAVFLVRAMQLLTKDPKRQANALPAGMRQRLRAGL